VPGFATAVIVEGVLVTVEGVLDPNAHADNEPVEARLAQGGLGEEVGGRDLVHGVAAAVTP